ncbi:GntR family transcriptional regulator [uncultured Cohaesibacter sp.]|uniref:GntR family transcriptional regulator n=1 Tax=uncultured Cohaesibacter sp. TaxID=1002546 RepID=UPI002AA6908A|nr:GntR family transcriptional regulator [uncultured Cohaesibacter sp.]
MPKSGYLAIKGYISNMIRSKEWPPGHLLPTETELAVQFNCARATVNRALGELAEEQIIDRRRKAGSRVRDGRERMANLKIQFPCREVEAIGKEHRYVALKREICALPMILQSSSEMGQSDQCLRTEGVHYAGDTPFQFEQSWFRRDAFPELFEAGGKVKAPCVTLLEKNPFYHGSLSISASKANHVEARHLGIKMGDPLINKEYILTDGHDGTPVAVMQIRYKPDYSISCIF